MFKGYSDTFIQYTKRILCGKIYKRYQGNGSDWEEFLTLVDFE